jgi:curved DNA-binding protein CbpA
MVTPAARAWWEVLDVPRSAGLAEIEAAFRKAAKAAHPDLGGNEAAMQEINAARAAALGERAA